MLGISIMWRGRPDWFPIGTLQDIYEIKHPDSSVVYLSAIHMVNAKPNQSASVSLIVPIEETGAAKKQNHPYLGYPVEAVEGTQRDVVRDAGWVEKYLDEISQTTIKKEESV